MGQSTSHLPEKQEFQVKIVFRSATPPGATESAGRFNLFVRIVDGSIDNMMEVRAALSEIGHVDDDASGVVMDIDVYGYKTIDPAYVVSNHPLVTTIRDLVYAKFSPNLKARLKPGASARTPTFNAKLDIDMLETMSIDNLARFGILMNQVARSMNMTASSCFYFTDVHEKK